MSFQDLLARPVGSLFAYSDCPEVSAPRVMSENHDYNRINWAAGLSDPGEMVACGYLPEARRQFGENDADYQARLLAMDLPSILGPDRFGRLLDAAKRRAGLNVRGGRVAMFSAREVPWHGLGTVIDRAATSAEALSLANLDNWQLSKESCFVQVHGQWVATDRWGIVRGDTSECLGTVGSRYEIVSNEECFDFLDSVIGADGARYETAGALGKGEQVWLLAKFPGETEVAQGDTLDNYIMFATSHDGSMAVKCFPTTIRTVCKNTYRAALRNHGRSGISMRHTKNIQKNIKAAREALGLAKAACDEFGETAKTLANKPMPNPDPFFAKLVDDALAQQVAGIPVTGLAITSGELERAIRGLPTTEERDSASKTLDQAKNKRKEWIDDILTRYESDRCNGNPAIAGSAWSAVNAVSEFADHSTKIRYKGSQRERAENRMLSILDGRAQELTQAAVSLAQTI